MAHPLGVVGADHVGYGSFDLWVLRNIRVAEKINLVLKAAKLLDAGQRRVTVGIRKLLVLPYKDPTIAFDAMKEGERGPNFICLRMDLDETMLVDRATWPPMPAMQKPNVLDCQLSPGSFSMSGALLTGRLRDAAARNLATQLIRFQQIVRTPQRGKAGSVARERKMMPVLPGFDGEISLGYRIEFRTEWFPLGHSTWRNRLQPAFSAGREEFRSPSLTGSGKIRPSGRKTRRSPSNCNTTPSATGP